MLTDAYSQCTNPYTRQMCIDNFNQIKNYCSQFLGIKHAINVVKHHALHENPELLCIHCKVLSILNEFNYQITDYKKITDYHENITNLKQLDELEVRLIMLECSLQELKKYYSKVTIINEAIKKIPSHIEMNNAPKIIKEFNDQIADCKRIVSYDGDISNENQLRKLEERLDRLDIYNKSLKRLWQVLPIAHKPSYQDPFLIRGWLEDPQNQHLLANVVSLRLSSHTTVLPIDLSKVPNLQELDLSLNRLTVFPEWISRYSTLKKLNLSFYYLYLSMYYFRKPRYIE